MTKKKLGSNKVREGKSSVPLQVTDNIELGQYPLNIEYEENLTYSKSNAYGTLFYGWKSFVHCPTIYVVEEVDTYATLRANIFSNDDIVYTGEGSFKIKGKTQAKTPVVNGYATQQLPNIQSWKKKNPYYSFIYYVYLPLNYCSARSNTAEIIYLPHTKRYSVIVKLVTEYVMGYTGDTVRVIARIYKTNTDVIINHSDVPDNGYARLIINGSVVGTTGVNDAGYVAFDYTITEKDCGVYPVLVEYVSQDEYYDDSACEGTLFVTSKEISLPTVTAPQTWHSLGSTASIQCTFSDISLFDKIQVYIDDQLVYVDGCDDDGYLSINDTKTTLIFDIPETYSVSYPWAYPGGHLMYIEYNDNINHVTRRLYLPFLMLQYPTEIQIKSYGLDNTRTMIVGNNIEGTVVNTFEIKRLVEHGLITIDIDKLEVLLSLISDVDCVVGIKHPSNQLFVNETGTFKVTLQSNTTVPIPGRTVKLVTPDKTYTSTTDDNGIATFTKQYTKSGNDDVYALFPSTETEAEKQTTPITIQIFDLIESVLSNTVSSNTLITDINPIQTGFPPSGTISVTFKPVPIITITQPPNNSNYEVGNSIIIKAIVLLEYKPATGIPVILRLNRTKEDGTIQNYDSLQTKNTDEDGIVTYTTSSSIPSECKYTLIIEDTDDYTQCSSDAIIVNVTRRATSTNIKMENKNIGTASILVTVKAVNTGEIVKTGTINILVDDTIVGTSTISSESTSVPITLDTPGTYDFVVNYVGTDTYASSTNTSLTGVSIVGKATTISASVINNYVGSANLEVTLLDENNNGVGEADIIVTLPDGSTCTGTTYSAGKVNIPLTSLLAGIYELTVAFNGNNKYAPASTTLSITVVKTSVTLTATATSSPQYINDNMTFSVKAVNDDNNSISNLSIVATLEAQYTDDTNETEDINIVTDENGIATFTTTCNKRGTYGVYFHFDGNDNYEQAQTTNTVYEITRRPTNINDITCNPASVSVGGKTSITATLIDTTLGTGIQDKEVKISLTNGTITSDTYTATTDNDGNVTIEYNVVNYGSYNITAIFEGDDTYDSVSVTQAGLTVSGLTVNTNAYFTDEEGNKITSIPIGCKAYIKGGCLAEDNTYPSPVYIKITKPDGTSTTRTAQNSKGYYSSPLYTNFLVTIGTYTFEVWTEETDTYVESNHYTAELSVTKVPVTITGEIIGELKSGTDKAFKVTVENNGTFEGIGIPTEDITIQYSDSEGESISNTDNLLSDGTQEWDISSIGSGEQYIYITYTGDDTHQNTSTTYECIIAQELFLEVTSHTITDQDFIFSNAGDCSSDSMPYGASSLKIMCFDSPLEISESTGTFWSYTANLTITGDITKESGTTWEDTRGYWINCSELAIGDHTITVQILDYEYYYSDAVTYNFTIIDSRTTPTLTITTESTTPENTTLQTTITSGATGNVTINENNTLLSTIIFTSTTNTQTVTLNNLTEGEHTFTINYEGDDNYQPISTTLTVTVSAKGVYDSSSWSGSPTIDSENNKITMNGTTINYVTTSIQDLLASVETKQISFTHYHNSRDGREAVGLYNPTTQQWIGYHDGIFDTDSNFSNQITNYTSGVYTSATCFGFGTEIPVTIDFTDTEITYTYTNRDGTENTTATIPLDGTEDLSSFYLAFKDYRGIGMYIRDITIGGGNN